MRLGEWNKKHYEGIELAGAFVAHMDFSINKRDVDFSVELYEQLADGNYLRLGQLMARASHCCPGCSARRGRGWRGSTGTRMVATI